ncbi:MAG: flagellar biosynthesis protein FlhB [Rickettsiaceae bacterium H1]|nr:flagellar biosynthesis protein FlhB [Rickettsiaceae bacterium H1]
MSDEQKTEHPTPKRLADSRKKGQTASSKEVTNVLMLITYSIIFAWFMPNASNTIIIKLKEFITFSHEFTGINVPDISSRLLDTIFHALGLPMALIIIGALLSNLVQNGFIFSTEPVMPKFSKISPKKGLKRIFSSKSIVEVISSSLKLILVITALFVIIKSEAEIIMISPELPLNETLMIIHRMIIKIIAGIIIITGFIATLDLFYQKFDYIKNLRMSKQEIKDETKHTEGNPEVKAKLRKLRMERANLNINEAIKKADVIITNPEHFAVALQYDVQTMHAPKVIAKGQDHQALKIKESAKQANVTIVENKPLAQVLFKTVEVDEFIPETHYKAVAEIINYVYKMKEKPIF